MLEKLVTPILAAFVLAAVSSAQDKPAKPESQGKPGYAQKGQDREKKGPDRDMDKADREREQKECEKMLEEKPGQREELFDHADDDGDGKLDEKEREHYGQLVREWAKTNRQHRQEESDQMREKR